MDRSRIVPVPLFRSLLSLLARLKNTCTMCGRANLCGQCDLRGVDVMLRKLFATRTVNGMIYGGPKKNCVKRYVAILYQLRRSQVPLMCHEIDMDGNGTTQDKSNALKMLRKNGLVKAIRNKFSNNSYMIAPGREADVDSILRDNNLNV